MKGKEKNEVNNFNDSDLKVLKELENIVKSLKNPFWKWTIGIVLVSSLINIFYQLGYFIGQLIAG